MQTVDAVKGEKPLAELAKLHDVHANQIVDWKNPLLEHAASVFGAVAFGRGIALLSRRLPAACGPQRRLASNGAGEEK